ncbi:S8 family serine peptidase [Halobacillus locisalis]|nr:S8 family serine peptidase [Halobacillus locisalis]
MRRLCLLFATILFAAGFSSPDVKEEMTIIIEVEGSPSEFAADVESRLPRLEIVAQYDTIFNGVAVRGKVEELEKLSRMDAITNQYPVQTYTTLKQEAPTFSTDIIREPLAGSFTGKGVKVGVIDTGIDYAHPDLQLNYRGGFDTVDFDNDPMETRADGATLHGTHVAGVIGANGQMRGVAPDAEIYAYRALGPGGMGSSVQVIAALEEAVKEGMDVINLSLGNDVNGPDWPTTHAVNRAIELGTTVIVAAGNSGPDAWTVGSPATSSEAITVGAVALPSEVAVLSVARREIPVQTLVGSKNWDLKRKYPLHFAGTGEQGIGDVRGKIVVFERGVIPFTEKAMKAYQAGAEAVLIYNNEKGRFQGSLDGLSIPIPVAAVSKEEGQWLIEQKDQWAATEWESLGEQMAPFSSRGPTTTNWAIKPDVVAPGVNIMSTVPGGYAPLQGTSMAAPHVAGLAALVIEAHPDWSPAKVKQAIMSSADLLDGYLPTEQGTGFIDATGAIEPDVLIDPGALEFGRIEDEFFRETKVITITNPTDDPVEIRAKQPNIKPGESWSVPSTVTIGPGESREVSVELRLSKAFVEDGVHQGYVTLESFSETYEIPYLYMKESADFAKVTGLELSPNLDGELTYRFYLSEGADNVTIDLYRAGTMMAAGQLLELKDVEAGMVEGTIKGDRDLGGAYVAVVTVERDDQEYSETFPVLLNN